jgi:D-cysteine desulfhydrase
MLTPGTTLVYACGSGGTGAGIVLGVKLLGLDVRTVGFAVCDDRAYFMSTIGAIIYDAIARYDLSISFDRDRDIEILDGYVGRGYAQSRPEELRLIRDVARKEGLLLDPVYTGKAFYGMTQELPRLGERIVFLHTGGIFGLFPKADELMEVGP